MSKIKAKQDNSQKLTKRAPKTKIMSTLTLIIALLLGLATIVGGIAAALAFLPRVSVVPSDPVDASNPFSASFTITNNNFIPLKEVSASLGLGQVVTAPAQLNHNFIPSFESRLIKPEWKNHTLTMDEKITITPADIFKLSPFVQLSGADIAIVVSYKPWFLPFYRVKVFRFIAKKQTNGLFYWYSLPIN